MAKHMVLAYLHFRILEFPLIMRHEFKDLEFIYPLTPADSDLFEYMRNSSRKNLGFNIVTVVKMPEINNYFWVMKNPGKMVYPLVI